MKDINVGDRILNYAYGSYFALQLKWLTVERVTDKMIYLGSQRTLHGLSQINKSSIKDTDLDTLPLRDDVYIFNVSDVDLELILVKLQEAVDLDRRAKINIVNGKYETSMKSIREFRGENL